MQTPDSVAIIDRFCLACETLIETNQWRGKGTFCRLYNVNRRNFYHFWEERTRGIFQVAWLSYIVRDWSVSPSWLLTGRGKMFLTKTTSND